MKAPYRYRVPDPAARLLGGLHPQIKRKIRAGLEMLAREPDAGKVLKGELEGLRSLPVGRYRLIYRVAQRRIVEIVSVGPRKSIYEETLRLVRKERAGGR